MENKLPLKHKKLKSLNVFVKPYLLWFFVLLIIPSFILIFLAFSNYDFSEGKEITFTFSNFSYVFSSWYAKDVFWPSVFRTLAISIIVTIVCLLIGYPIAYYMTKIKTIYRTMIMILLVLPLWVNQVLRIVSWRTIFEVLNMNVKSSYYFNIVLAMTSMYLPYMILPIYTVLEKIEPGVIEASYDLGCNRLESFLKVVFPLSLGGIVSGFIMTFLPALTQFEVSDAISYQSLTFLGNLIYQRFQGMGGFNVGSVFSILTVIFTIVGFIIVTRSDKEGETLI